MSDLEQAKKILAQGGYTCVLCKGERILTSQLRGVAPMMEFLASKTDLKGCSAADKVVGKAPAFLFVLAGVSAVHAPVMTHAAAEILARYGIQASYEELVDTIQNRTNTGPCPMERAVGEIDDPNEAYEAIQKTMLQLKNAAAQAK